MRMVGAGARGGGGRARRAEFVEVLDQGFVLGVQSEVGLEGEVAVVVVVVVGDGGGGFRHGVEGEGGRVR